GGGETYIATVVDHADPVAKPVQDLPCIVSRGIIHHHNLEGNPGLLQNSFQTCADISATIIGDDRNRHGSWFFHCLKDPEPAISTTLKTGRVTTRAEFLSIFSEKV